MSVQLGFRGKLIGATVSLILGFVTVASLIFSSLIDRSAEQHLEGSLESGRRSYVNYMTLEWQSLRHHAESNAQNKRVINLASTGDIETVKQSMESVELADGLGFALVTDANGRTLGATAGAPKVAYDLSMSTGVESALQGKVGRATWRVGDEMVLVALAPIVESGGLLGVFVVGSRLDEAAARSIADVTGRDVLLVHGDAVISHAWADGFDRPLEADERAALVEDVAACFDEAESGPLSLTLGGRPSLALAIPMQDRMNGGVLVLAHDLQEIKALHREAQAWLLACGLTIGAVGVLIALRMSSTMTRPLRDLMRAADAMTAGELTARVAVASSDDVGRLGRSFNRMCGTIEELVVSVCEEADRAESANRAKDAFLASTSHELRTPLAGIMAASEILQNFGPDCTPEERREFLGMLDKESHRLSYLIGHVLDFSLLESGQMTWVMDELDLLDVVEVAVASRAEQAGEKGIRLQVTGSPDIEVHGDRERLSQVFGHLIDNACAFAPSDSEVSIVLSRSDGDVEVRVGDRGPGIPDEDKQRVFERFFQCGDPLTEKPPGAGLGLTMSREIAAAHGGDVWCEDNPGGGALFVVRLPQGEPPLASLEGSEETPTERVTSGVRVMLSDSGVHRARRG